VTGGVRDGNGTVLDQAEVAASDVVIGRVVVPAGRHAEVPGDPVDFREHLRVGLPVREHEHVDKARSRYLRVLAKEFREFTEPDDKPLALLGICVVAH